MSELMTKQTIENYAEICLRIPANNKDKIEGLIRNMLALVNLDYSVIENTDTEQDSISLEEMFPNLHPGSAIRGLRYREGLTQAQLAKKIGISSRYISKMENGKSPIGKDMAKRLAKGLNTVYKVFISETH